MFGAGSREELIRVFFRLLCNHEHWVSLFLAVLGCHGTSPFFSDAQERPLIYTRLS